jgi:cytochrome P450
MINLGDPDIITNPLPTYQLMRDKNPVCRLLPGNIYALSRYEDVKNALRRHDIYSSQGAAALSAPAWLKEQYRRHLFILVEDPPLHTDHRALVNKGFIAGVVNGLIPLMHNTALFLTDRIQRLTDRVQPQTDIDFLQDFAFPYVGKIAGVITGTEGKEHESHTREWLYYVQRTGLEKPCPEFIQAYEKVTARQNLYFDHAIQRRRETPTDDLITKLINAEVDGIKLNNAMLNNALDLFIRAGYLTTLHLLGNSILKLSRTPQMLLKLREAPDLIPAFIEEMLRCHSPTRCTIRETTQEVNLHTVSIPARTTVLLLLSAANYDPRKFNQPERFDITRNDAKDHISFGHGPHTCLGMALARLEVKVALEALLPRISALSCPDDSKLSWIPSYLMHGLEKLPVRIQWAAK